MNFPFRIFRIAVLACMAAVCLGFSLHHGWNALALRFAGPAQPAALVRVEVIRDTRDGLMKRRVPEHIQNIHLLRQLSTEAWGTAHPVSVPYRTVLDVFEVFRGPELLRELPTERDTPLAVWTRPGRPDVVLAVGPGEQIGQRFVSATQAWGTPRFDQALRSLLWGLPGLACLLCCLWLSLHLMRALRSLRKPARPSRWLLLRKGRVVPESQPTVP